MRFKYLIICTLLFLLALFSTNGLEIKDIEYSDSSQYLIVTVSNPTKEINSNISIYGYINGTLDTHVEMINYTIPEYSLMFIRKKMIFNEKGLHTVVVVIKTKNMTYTFYKKLNITYAYNSRVPAPKEYVSKKIEIEGVSFEICPYPYPPFYDFVDVCIRNNDYIPHYVNISFSASLQGPYYIIKDNKIIKSSVPSNATVITSWTPDIYVPPKSKIVIPIKVNFYYSGDYEITVKAVSDDHYSSTASIKNESVILKSITGDEVKFYNVKISCPILPYNITCEDGYDDYAHSNWFDVKLYNTVDYDVYGTVEVFLCKKEGKDLIILDNKTINKYFVAGDLNEGYTIPVKLNTSAIDPYDTDFEIFILCKTGNMQTFYNKTFKKPITINNLNITNYPQHYYFVDDTIFYDVYVNITNNMNKKIYANISITDIYNRTYSQEVELNRSYNLIKFKGLKIDAKDLSHEGRIKLNFTIAAITPPYTKYYTIKSNKSIDLSLIPTPPVYVCSDLNDEIYVGYYQNLSFSVKKVVGRNVEARVFITVPKEIKNYTFFEEKYVNIKTMKEVPVNIETLFLKEYNGPIYIHVDTNMGVRECVVARIVNAKSIVSCDDVEINNYTVFIKIRNWTQGFVKNEPIVGYPVNITVFLKSEVPNLKNVKIWAAAMNEKGELINCSEVKTVNIYGTYKKVKLRVLFNDSLEGYLVIFAKTGKAIIPLYYKPIMVTYPIIFNVEYNPLDPWANLTLSHNYQVPIKINASIDGYSKIITIYPYKETKVPFYVGKNRNNITVKISLLENISSIKNFQKTFYFLTSKESKIYYTKNESLINESFQNITQLNNITKKNESNITTHIPPVIKNESVSNFTIPPNIQTESSTQKYNNISKKELELFYNITGITAFKNFVLSNLRNMILLLITAIIVTVIALLLYEPTRPKIISLIATILYKLKLRERKESKEKIGKLPKPPKIYIREVIYSLGDVVTIELYSDWNFGECLYILSPSNKKYRIKLQKLDDKRYIGVFKIPENEKTGQYYVIYEPENLPLAGFLVIGIKERE
ncbi:MAG: hypothetical protein GXN95_00500 [Methanococci archaeon]|nr:hypothetical protein [Methanococci archaeon]